VISAELRRTVRTIYAFACGYCGVTETEVGAHLTVDHYQPQDAGGSDEISNLVYACHACNLYKAAASNPQQATVLHPLRDNLTLHIRLLPDGLLQDLTPEGKLHIEALHLNRFPLVERRRIRRLIEALLEQETQDQKRQQQIDQAVRRKKRALRAKMFRQH
jgi:hypothetical protein